MNKKPHPGQQFKPGQSGNPGGRPKTKEWKAALKRQLEAHAETNDDNKLASGLNKIAKVVVQKAMEGDKDAWQEIGNRFDGKVTQEIEHTGQVGFFDALAAALLSGAEKEADGSGIEAGALESSSGSIQ